MKRRRMRRTPTFVDMAKAFGPVDAMLAPLAIASLMSLAIVVERAGLWLLVSAFSSPGPAA